MIDPADYLDFELQVSPNIGGDLEVQVMISPRNRPRSRFEPPCSAAEALALLDGLDREIRRRAKGTGPGAGEPPDLRRIGERFFASLFPPLVLETLDASLDRPRGDGEGLRIRLAFDPLDKALAPCGALPWEALFHPGKRQFLARRRELALVRYIDVPVDIQRLYVKPPLRVLLVAADAENQSASTVREEQRLVYQMLRENPRIDVECVEPPTLDELLDRLGRRPAHVVHFMGHGGFDRPSGHGAVFFEDGEAGEDPVYGRQLAEQLAPFFSSLRLVVLNSCHGATGRRDGGQAPFVDVTSALIAGGLTAVVGMQFLISNPAAICFAGAFYEALAETGHVEVAAARARRKLHQRDEASPEWITPAVFTRAANGRLFDPTPQRLTGGRIGIRSFFGWGVEIENWSHAFLPLTSFFRGRYLAEGVGWQAEIYPRLAAFLDKAVFGRKAVHLDFAAHHSIAFAAGYLLDAKAGIAITIRQRTAQRSDDWRPDDLAIPGAESWLIAEHPVNARDGEEQPLAVNPGCDIAMAIGATREVLTSVKKYVEAEAPGIGWIVEFKPPGGASQLSVKGSWHAFGLAEAISNKIHQLTSGDWEGTFHLFYAGPNGLLFFLGRLCRGPRRIQLYEYDFDGEGPRTYMPSLNFPPPGVGNPAG